MGLLIDNIDKVTTVTQKRISTLENRIKVTIIRRVRRDNLLYHQNVKCRRKWRKNVEINNFVKTGAGKREWRDFAV